MAEWRLFMAVAATLAVITHVARAQADCSNAIASLSPCIKYIAGGDVSNPAQACCTALASVVKTDPLCLCQVLTNSNINQTQALALPQACKVSTPPASQCKSGASPSTGTPGKTGSSDADRVLAPSVILSILTVAMVLTKALR